MFWTQTKLHEILFSKECFLQYGLVLLTFIRNSAPTIYSKNRNKEELHFSKKTISNLLYAVKNNILIKQLK